jgi:drug/metabolite transporter (DMT)-like permease
LLDVEHLGVLPDAPGDAGPVGDLVGVAALAARLSVILPTVTAFFLYGDSAHALKLAGIAIAVVALYLSSFEKAAGPALDRGLQSLPILLFLSFGMNLVLAKYVQAHHLDRMTYHGYLMYAFGFAFLSGLAAWGWKYVRGRTSARKKDIYAGVLLGVNNYGSLYFMIRTIAQPGWESSVVFPTISASVVMLSFLGAFAIFGERASRRKLTALVVGVVAIVLINSH